MNRVVIVGRMTRDPELKSVNGNSVCRFTLAIDRNFKSGDGQQADFIPVVVWSKGAENVARYCGKGSLVGVDGQLRSRSYNNKNGEHVFVVEVRADNVQFLETRAARERNQANARNRAASDNFYNSNPNNSVGNANYNNQQASPQNNRQFNTASVNQNQPKPQNQNNGFHEVDAGFNEANSYNIMDDDIQF